MMVIREEIIEDVVILVLKVKMEILIIIIIPKTMVKKVMGKD